MIQTECVNLCRIWKSRVEKNRIVAKVKVLYKKDGYFLVGANRKKYVMQTMQ